VIIQKFSHKKIEFEEEKALTPDKQLQKGCDTLIQGQKAWLAFELVGVFSDIAKGVIAVCGRRRERSRWGLARGQCVR